MKNLLLASTALVASTAFAMADVDISGNAEMGVFGVNFDEDIDDVDDLDLQFHTDINVTFTMAGETDAGLTFGAEVELSDIDQNDGAATGDDSDDGGVVIFVSGALGTLTMGDTDGAFDFALQEAIIGSAIADDHEHAGYNGNNGLDGFYDGQVARYDYTFGDFSFAVSGEIDDGAVNADVDGDPVLGIGGRYNGNFAGFDFGAGIGYQRVGGDVVDDITGDDGDADADLFGLSLSTEVAGFSIILNYSELDVDFDGVSDLVDGLGYDHYGIAVGYTFGEILVAANYGEFDFDNGLESSGYGLVVNYDLGGGAALELGYGNSSLDDRDDVLGVGDDIDSQSYSFGISMDF